MFDDNDEEEGEFSMISIFSSLFSKFSLHAGILVEFSILLSVLIVFSVVGNFSVDFVKALSVGVLMVAEVGVECKEGPGEMLDLKDEDKLGRNDEDNCEEAAVAVTGSDEEDGKTSWATDETGVEILDVARVEDVCEKGLDRILEAFENAFTPAMLLATDVGVVFDVDVVVAVVVLELDWDTAPAGLEAEEKLVGFLDK